MREHVLIMIFQVQPGNVEVSSIASRVSNGELVSSFPSPLPSKPQPYLSDKITCESVHRLVQLSCDSKLDLKENC